MAREPTRRAVIQGGLALTLGSAGFAARAEQTPEKPKLAFAGVNLAGAEFGKVPGRYGYDYTYPDAANINYYANLGFNIIRLPFLWERLQPTLGAPFVAEEFARLDAVVSRTGSKGQSIVLDPHNYARRRIADDNWKSRPFIGSREVPTAAFADLWRRLAETYKNNPRVIFGLMNEPAGIAIDPWFSAAQAAVTSIRETGARNLILVPGIDYTGAHSWQSSGNTRMGKIVDPANNLVFEVHQYLDRDSSGTSPEAVSTTIGSQRVKGFQNWARENGVKGFLGEFGAADNEQSLAALRDLCQTLEDNADVWIGWTAWAAGAWWPQDYFLNLEPTKAGNVRKQTEILSEFAKRVATSG